MYNQGLACGITEYTRIELYKNKITKSCIDHIYARSRSLNLYTAALGTTLADHRATALACCGAGSNTRPGFNHITKYHYKTLVDSLKQIDWQPAKQAICPLKMYNIIAENIQKCYEKSRITIKIPTNTKRSTHTWINTKIIKACEHRDTLFIKWISDPTNRIIKQKYNSSRNYANKLINKSKNKHIRDEIIANKNNPRALWQILNSITGRAKSIADTIILNAMLNNNNTTSSIANNFAESFASSVQNIVPKCDIKLLNKNDYTSPVNASCRFQPTTAKSILTEIRSMNDRKAPGSDNIRVKDLKTIDIDIAEILSKFINAAVKEGKYPQELKTGIVKPIHKKGCHKNYDNYRQITILNTINKIVEKALSKQIHSFYTKHNIITDKQYGFQAGKNTTQLLTKFTDNIYGHLNNKEHILVAFIDYSKAFDTLKHNTLIEKLNDCGIRGPLGEWCKDYLNERSFSVKVGDSLSKKTKVSEGTAQGSVLGPLHYITYVNDVVSLIKHCEIYQFADDTCLTAASNDINTALKHLQSDFTLLTKWSHDAGLVLNAKKTTCMYISSSQNRITANPKLIVHNHNCLHAKDSQNCCCPAVEVVSKQRYLGLIFDDRLKWTDHINHICDKLRAILAKIKIVKQKIPYLTLLQLYKALGETTIHYGLSSYGRTCKSHLDPIYALQLRILKSIVPPKIKNKYKNNYHELFYHCKVIPVHYHVQYSLLIENFFNTTYQKKIHRQKQTRSALNNKLEVPHYNNLYGKQMLQYQIPTLINHLPLNIKSEITKNNIKNKLTLFFSSHNPFHK